MSEYTREKQLKKKREYYREWRAEHQESVKASQIRYWTKKAEEVRSRNAAGDPGSGGHE